MARVSIGSGRMVVDFDLVREEENGAVALVSSGHSTSSTGLDFSWSHELSERDEISIDGGKKIRRVGASDVAIPFIGKNGIADGNPRKFGKVDTDDNRPFYIGGTNKEVKIGGKVVTDGVLSVARSIGNNLWEQIVFSLLEDGTAPNTPAKSNAVIGEKILSDYRATLIAQSTAIAALPNALEMFAMMNQVVTLEDGATLTDLVEWLVAKKADALKSEWEAAKKKSDADKVAREAKNAAEVEKILPEVKK